MLRLPSHLSVIVEASEAFSAAVSMAFVSDNAEGAAEVAVPAEANWGYYSREGGAVQWMRQCSKHLVHIEERLMRGNFMGHEVMRQICIMLDSFTPPPRGDWALRCLRRCEATRWAKQKKLSDD